MKRFKALIVCCLLLSLLSSSLTVNAESYESLEIQAEAVMIDVTVSPQANITIDPNKSVSERVTGGNLLVKNNGTPKIKVQMSVSDTDYSNFKPIADTGESDDYWDTLTPDQSKDVVLKWSANTDQFEELNNEILESGVALGSTFEGTMAGGTQASLQFNSGSSRSGGSFPTVETGKVVVEYSVSICES